jgi:hypothetical protein
MFKNLLQNNMLHFNNLPQNKNPYFESIGYNGQWMFLNILLSLTSF